MNTVKAKFKRNNKTENDNIEHSLFNLKMHVYLVHEISSILIQ